MVKAHRQAWAWQDEWVGLSIEDIREMERQIQLALQRKFAGDPDADGEYNEEETDSSAKTADVDGKSNFDKIDTQTPKENREMMRVSSFLSYQYRCPGLKSYLFSLELFFLTSDVLSVCS